MTIAICGMIVLIIIITIWLVREIYKENHMDIKVNTHGNAQTFERHGAMIDLATAEDVKMKQGEIKLISLGVSMELPKGYYARLYSRSSTAKRHGVILANGVGIIDNSYCGDNDIWRYAAYAIRDTEIPAGTRIAQFEVVQEQQDLGIVEVESLGNTDRGGFGSTGR